MSLADLAGLDLGVDLGAGDPEPPPGVEVHLDRLGQERVGGEQVDLEPLGDLERRPLGLGVGVDDRDVLLEREERPEPDRPAQDQPLAEPSPPGGQPARRPRAAAGASPARPGRGSGGRSIPAAGGRGRRVGSWIVVTGPPRLLGSTRRRCGTGHAEPGDLRLLGGDERVELGDLAGVLPLLVLAEAEEVRLVLGPPAVEIQLVLGVDRRAEGLDLVELGALADRRRPPPRRRRRPSATAWPSTFRA